MDKFDRDYLSCYEVTEIAKIHCYYYDTDERVYNTFKRRVENRKKKLSSIILIQELNPI